MSAGFDEAVVEQAALEYLRQLGYATEFGPNIAPDRPRYERDSFEQVYLHDRLRQAAKRHQPRAPRLGR